METSTVAASDAAPLSRTARRKEGRKRAKAFEEASAPEEPPIDPHGDAEPPVVPDAALLVAFQDAHAARYRDYLASRTSLVSDVLHAADTWVLAAVQTSAEEAWAAACDREGFSLHVTRAYPTSHRASSVEAVLKHLQAALALERAAGEGAAATAVTTLRVQAHPPALERALQDALELAPDVQPSPTGFSHFLVAAQPTPRSAVRFGLYPARLFAAFQREGSVQRPVAATVCKAQHKLSEALQLLGPAAGIGGGGGSDGGGGGGNEDDDGAASSQLSPTAAPPSPPPTPAAPSPAAAAQQLGTALDVGAAPGGWTACLAARARRVVAIDPAALDSAVLALPNVTHLRLRADEATAKLLGGEVDGVGSVGGVGGVGGDGGDGGGGDGVGGGVAGGGVGGGGAAAAASCELLVCDCNMDAIIVCQELLLPLAPLLAPGAGLVLTLKLPRRCSNHRVGAIAADCARLLAPAFDGARTEHLFANTGNERTLLARRRAPPVE